MHDHLFLFLLHSMTYPNRASPLPPPMFGVVALALLALARQQPSTMDDALFSLSSKLETLEVNALISLLFLCSIGYE